MRKSISIIDKDYKQWVKTLVVRYRQSQIKAAVKVNQEVLRFYWELGKDIVERDAKSGGTVLLIISGFGILLKMEDV